MTQKLLNRLRSEVESLDSMTSTTPHLSNIRNATALLVGLLETREGEASPAEPLTIHGLIGAVRDAIASYDRGRDHLRHDAGGDCVRCRLAAVIKYEDPRFVRPGLHSETSR